MPGDIERFQAPPFASDALPDLSVYDAESLELIEARMRASIRILLGDVLPDEQFTPYFLINHLKGRVAAVHTRPTHLRVSFAVLNDSPETRAEIDDFALSLSRLLGESTSIHEVAIKGLSEYRRGPRSLPDDAS